MTPKFLIPIVDIVINETRKISHSFNLQIRRWRFNPHKLKRVLINKLDPGNGIGDYIQCSALVTALKQASPDVDISFLVSGKEELVVFELFPYRVSLINLHPSNINYNNLLEFAKTNLYSKEFDLVIHGYGENPQCAKLISEQGNIQNSIGYFSETEQGHFPFLTIRAPYNFKGVRPFSYDNQLKKILDITLDWKVNLDRRFLNRGNDDRKNKKANKILGLHPGCNVGNKEKRWPTENFIQVASWFTKQFDGNILIFGGPHEEDDVRMMVAQAGNHRLTAVVNQSLLKVASLIDQCDIFVSNDSGLMNLSMALGVPSIGICGPTDMNDIQYLFPEAVFLGERMPCCPCYNTDNYMSCIESPGDGAKCLELIKPQEVIEKIEQILEHNYKYSNVNRILPQIRDIKLNKDIEIIPSSAKARES